jgi:hypothetical protein
VRRVGVEVAAEPVGLHGDVEGGAALGAFEDGVLDKVADAVPLGGLVARAAPDPDADGGGAQRGHPLGQNGEPVGESRRLNLFGHYFGKLKGTDPAGTLSDTLFGRKSP